VPSLRRRNILSDGLKDVLGREQGKHLREGFKAREGNPMLSWDREHETAWELEMRQFG